MDVELRNSSSSRTTRTRNTVEEMISPAAKSKKSNMHRLRTWTRVADQCPLKATLQITTHSTRLKQLPAKPAQQQWAQDKEYPLPCSNQGSLSHKGSNSPRDSTSHPTLSDSHPTAPITRSHTVRTFRIWPRLKAIC
jgi:hypothetical protein